MKKLFLFFLFLNGICDAQLFSENFNGNALPAGWTVENPNSAYNWGVGSENDFASFPDGAAFFDDDNAGPSGVNSNARLISPVISLTGAVNPKLSFKYANKIYNLNSTLKVEVFNGTSWVQAFSSGGASGTWTIDFSTFSFILTDYVQTPDIDLTPYINANFKLRFVYDDLGDYSYGVVVDDVVISEGVLATSEVAPTDRVNLYPNPVKDYVSVMLPDPHTVAAVSVIDMAGKTVKTFEKKSGPYDLSDLPKGVYIMMITDGHKEIIRKKIIKQ
ncbi:T9SS-dependent choice-of-anchor J family protein [Chryseobacterium pennipullorum]|uniref:Secretion system C-terminal sorting domain-containing protein n=1 Tax=Chryseobacterium pennipullorum TaxID=2258963 RepID=A0A3D9APL4_9FLAO|nr:T9SS type A sorting domain-containing protein [Chryseobacterium pennipullorum]REC43135.1 hypothetical protein DRF67_19915 [Chryseobacterium pennipullorum]